jgi:hypothetical protein
MHAYTVVFGTSAAFLKIMAAQNSLHDCKAFIYCHWETANDCEYSVPCHTLRSHVTMAIKIELCHLFFHG